MPIYEYECKNCHNQFDLMQKISDTPAKQCPQCLKDTAIRLVSAAGFQLKGSGWYATDFKNKNTGSSKPDTTKAAENKAPDTKTTVDTNKGEKD
ncbi:MAG: zinc ribbon domain-containing protein [Legionella sp.]|nr:zinc ribbon domain-containing protein [Legionella sp.]